MAKKKKAATAAKPDERPVCFIIMPISEIEGRPTDHFRKVYKQIFEPACGAAGYRAVRADDVRQTNLIHIDLLDKIINAPMAICDLSTLNPNVMFELGIRQAFDKPVVLVREKGTKDVFDIGPLRFTEYRKERIYDELIDDIEKISQAIEATRDSTDGVNSIVRLLSVTQAASIPHSDQNPTNALLEIIRSEMAALRGDVGQLQIKAPRRSFSEIRSEITSVGDKLIRQYSPEVVAALRRVGSAMKISDEYVAQQLELAIKQGAFKSPIDFARQVQKAKTDGQVCSIYFGNFIAAGE